MPSVCGTHTPEWMVGRSLWAAREKYLSILEEWRAHAAERVHTATIATLRSAFVKAGGGFGAIFSWLARFLVSNSEGE